MLSLGLMASTLLLAYGGMAFADAVVPSQVSEALNVSSVSFDRGVNPRRAAPADFDLTGKVWLFNSTVTTNVSDMYVSVDATCGDTPVTNIYVSNPRVYYAFNGSSDQSVYEYGAWLSESYRTLTFNSDVSDVSLKNWIYDNGSEVAPPSLGEQIVDIIGSGLGVITELGNALTSGFDAIFLDNDALSNVGVFSFVLLGLGISVGITKKCFNWITGRHGM